MLKLLRLTSLYLIEILHQTTTQTIPQLAIACCILLKFYIKPQLRIDFINARDVVSY